MTTGQATATLRAIIGGGRSRRRHGRLTNDQKRVRRWAISALEERRAAVRGDRPGFDEAAYVEEARTLQGAWATATEGKVGQSAPLNP